MSARRDVRGHRHLGDIELEPAHHAAERVDERVDLHELELAGPRLYSAVLEGFIVSLRAGDDFQLELRHRWPWSPSRAAFRRRYSHGMSDAWITPGTPWPP